MIRPLFFVSTIFLVSIVISSCATLKQPQETHEMSEETVPSGWNAEKAVRQNITSWEIRGRLGVQTKDTGGTMDIIWQQSLDDFTVHLLAPLGAGNYLIQGNKTFAEIRHPDGYRQVVDDIDTIFLSLFEVDLPVTAVKDWVRGLPAKELKTDEIHWDRQGRLNRVKQAGWNVEMTRYAGEGISMPHAIYISRDDDADLDIRLLLRQWLVDN